MPGSKAKNGISSCKNHGKKKKSLKFQTWEILLEKLTIIGTEEVSSLALYGYEIINVHKENNIN